jgi:hypothetical protein
MPALTIAFEASGVTKANPLNVALLPSGFVTVIATVPAGAVGAITTMEFGPKTCTLAGGAATVPNETVRPSANPEPSMLTGVPPAELTGFGETPEIIRTW